MKNEDKIKLINYAYKESKGSAGIPKVGEMTGGFNLKMTEQVKKLGEKNSLQLHSS